VRLINLGSADGATDAILPPTSEPAKNKRPTSARPTTSRSTATGLKARPMSARGADPTQSKRTGISGHFFDFLLRNDQRRLDCRRTSTWSCNATTKIAEMRNHVRAVLETGLLSRHRLALPGPLPLKARHLQVPSQVLDPVAVDSTLLFLGNSQCAYSF